MDIKCKKCGCDKISTRQDKRDLPEFYCSECGAFIKKAGATELYEYFTQITAASDTPAPPVVETEQAPCPHCFDNYARLGGRCLHLREQFRHKYCPECGRKLKANELI